MVELVSFDCGQLCFEFLENEIISFGFVIVVENEGMAQTNK